MTPEALDALVASGATAEMIAAAWKAEMLKDAERLTIKRKADAERKARSRNVTQCHADINGQPVTAADISGPPFLDKESFPQTPFKEINPNPVGGTRTRGTRIPHGWSPTRQLPFNVAELVAQWPPGRYDRELEGFRDYWESRQRNAAMLDWDKTWHNRIRDQHDRIIRENRNGHASRKNGSGNGFFDAAVEWATGKPDPLHSG